MESRKERREELNKVLEHNHKLRLGLIEEIGKILEKAGYTGLYKQILLEWAGDLYHYTQLEYEDKIKSINTDPEEAPLVESIKNRMVKGETYELDDDCNVTIMDERDGLCYVKYDTYVETFMIDEDEDIMVDVNDSDEFHWMSIDCIEDIDDRMKILRALEKHLNDNN